MAPQDAATKQRTAPIDDLFFTGEAAPITESDERLAELVAQAELPVLLAAIAAATDDVSALEPGLRPPLTPVDTTPHPHGGMTPEQQERARELALAGLIRLRDEGITSVGALDAERVDAILEFLTDGREEWVPSLKHELNVSAEGKGAPDWTAEEALRTRDFPVLIAGAGVGGVAAAHRFLQAGLPITVVEAGPAVGGTWLKNRYPGVRLDTPTFGYSYSFAQKGDWPHQFAEGGEILEYVQEVADRAGIVPHTEFGTRLVSAVWNEEAGAWDVTTETSAGTRVRRFSAVISAVGQLDRPNIPDFPGLEDYRGRTVHSQEWTEDITWAGKRVAVIGTGASAYQIVPAIAHDAAELVLFQRSAPWMLPAPNYHDPMTDGFRWFTEKVPNYAQWYRLWMVLGGIPGRFHTVTAEDDWAGAPLSVSAKNQEVRDELIARLREQFAAREDLAAIAVPGYPPGAKRMLRDNGVWAEALQRETTTVVTAGIARFTERGIVDGAGIEHEVDLVVLATGFKPSDYLEGIEVVGRGGLRIHDFWDGDARAFNGVTVPGFPNFFLLFGPNVGGVVAGGLHFMLERAAEYALRAVRQVLERDARAIDVRPEALERFVSWVDAGNRRMSWGQPYVSTWYQNASGRVSQVWPYTNAEYWQATETVADEDHEYL